MKSEYENEYQNKVIFKKSECGMRNKIIDIDVSEDAASVRFGKTDEQSEHVATESELLHESYKLRNIHKVFPQVKTLYISKNVGDIEIPNEMFPNVRKVISDNKCYASGTMLVKINCENKKILLNSFCLSKNEIIDMEGIYGIEGFAFSGCESVNIKNEENVKQTNELAFANSEFLKNWNNGICMAGSILIKTDSCTDITFPNNVTHIMRGAIEKAKSLTIEIKDLLKYSNIIKCDGGNKRYYIFMELPKHVNILGVTKDMYPVLCQLYEANYIDTEYIEVYGNGFQSKAGMLYNEDGTVLLKCPIRRNDDIRIPEGTTEIAERAFFNCRITNIYIPGSVKVIRNNAFTGCFDLLSVIIEPGLEEIEKSAFKCSSLESITIPCTLKKMATSSLLSAKKVVIRGKEIPKCLFAAVTTTKENDMNYKCQEYTEIIYDDFVNFIPKLINKQSSKIKLIEKNKKEAFFYAAANNKTAQLVSYLYLKELHERCISLTKIFQ